MSGTESVWLRTRESLLGRLKGTTDGPSWDEFYQMYWRAIYGYSLRLGLGHADAEDIVQEVFIKVARKLPAFKYDRAQGRFLSWIRTITRTTVMDLYRRRNARPQDQLGSRDPAALRHETAESIPAVIGEAPDPWREEWEESVLALAMERVAQRVDASTFEAFRLNALEEKPAEEVARLLNISRNAAYVKKNRVLNLLREEVATIQNES